jgi:hypothetical protein
LPSTKKNSSLKIREASASSISIGDLMKSESDAPSSIWLGEGGLRATHGSELFLIPRESVSSKAGSRQLAVSSFCALDLASDGSYDFVNDERVTLKVILTVKDAPAWVTCVSPAFGGLDC